MDLDFSVVQVWIRKETQNKDIEKYLFFKN